ncbi:MAG: LCP family protein [Schwartzia sp.]|nr:LCP family protein [Schwartzia sp. (in: firmicutes)]
MLGVVLLAVGVGAGLYFASSSLFDKPGKRVRTETSRPYKPTETLLVAKDKTTVMIMGVDERTDDVGRSDTLMLATVDPKKKSASLLSIPRDTRVHVPGYGYDKINVAYSLGGHELTQDTVEEFLDTPVEHYVLIKVPAFKRIIDAIGGVDIDVEKRMYYVDEWDDDGGLYIDLYPGPQHMDGATAITYVRYRDEEGDIGRIERQQKFMKAVMDQVMSPSIIPRLPSIIREVMSSVETDLSFRQCLELAGALKEAQSNGLATKMVAGRPMYIDEISYWIPDVYDIREDMADMLGIALSQSAKSEMERDASAYAASIPANAKEAPEDDTTVGRLVREGTKPNAMGDRDRVTLPTSPRSDKTQPGDKPRPSTTSPTTKPTETGNNVRDEETDETETAAGTKKPATTSGSEDSDDTESVTKPTAPVRPTIPTAPTPSNVPSPNTSGSKRN